MGHQSGRVTRRKVDFHHIRIANTPLAVKSR
jgi:hypothetical protein